MANKPGPASRITTQQVIEAAKRFYEDDVSQIQLAQELGISTSYMARRIIEAKRDGLIRVRVETDISDDSLAADGIRHNSGQAAMLVNGSIVLVSIDARSAKPMMQQIAVDGVVVTLIVTRTTT